MGFSEHNQILVISKHGNSFTNLKNSQNLRFTLNISYFVAISKNLLDLKVELFGDL